MKKLTFLGIILASGLILTGCSLNQPKPEDASMMQTDEIQPTGSDPVLQQDVSDSTDINTINTELENFDIPEEDFSNL